MSVYRAVDHDGQIAKLAEQIGAPELASDPRLANNALHSANRVELKCLLEARLTTSRSRSDQSSDTLEAGPSNARAPMKPEQTLVSVVLLGQFKPADFELEAIGSSKALGADDLRLARYEALLHNQVSQIVLPWGKLTAMTDRLSIDVTQVPYVRCVDLVLKLMHEVSVASLVTKFGINVIGHFKFDSVAARDGFASRLVPPSAWGAFGSAVKVSFKEKQDRHGGLMRVTVRQARPDERPAGWIDVTIEPSALIENDQGVAISINDHHELPEDASPRNAQRRAASEQLLMVLEEQFDQSVANSFAVCDDILKG
jgi:hypothetical protein